MADLTPETALAMALHAEAHGEEHSPSAAWDSTTKRKRDTYTRISSSAVVALSLLGFEVRRRDATDPESEALRRRPDQECR